MRYEYNRTISNELLSKKMFDEYIPSFYAIDNIENREHNLLLLIVLCGFVSKEEIVTFTGMSYRFCEKLISGLLRDGYVESIPLKLSKSRYVSRAGALYTFTKKGYEIAKGFRGGHKIINDYRKKKANPKNVHDYANGMNLFASIIGLNGIPFDWIRERVYGKYMRGSKGALAVDGEISLLGFTLHIEQDIANESNPVLLDKLFYYQKYPERGKAMLSSDEHALLISYYVPNTLESAAFHPKNLTALARMVQDQNTDMPMEDAFYGIELPSELSNTLKELTRMAGGKKKEKCGLKVSDLLAMSGRFTSENPFYQNVYKQYQYRKFTAKREELGAMLSSMPDYESIRLDIYKGAPIYIAPTLLLERYIRLICDFKSYFEKLSACLSSYFGTLSFQEYSPRGAIDQRLTLRNHFSSECGAIYVEYPTIDLGAMMRIRRFMERSEELPSVNHLILLVDYASEALEIAKRIKDFKRKRQQVNGFMYNDTTYAGIYEKKDKNDLYFLKRSDLEAGHADRLFYAYGYREVEDDNGNFVGIGKNEICYLLSDTNPRWKKEGF